MFRELLSRVAREVRGDRALEAVCAIALHHRIQSTPGYDEAAAWVAEAATQAGLEVEIDRVPGDGRTRYLGALMPEGWSASVGRAFLVDGATRSLLCDFDAEPLSIVQRSMATRGRFPIVLDRDGEGLDGEARGAVVLTRDTARRGLERLVRGRGAVGLVCEGRRLVPPVRERHHDPDSIAYTSFWWDGDEPRAFGVVVSPRIGESLRGRLTRGATLSLEVEIESRRFATEIPLVSARLPGGGPEEVLVLAHLCHPRPGANDNASGAAAALETARALGALAHSREGLPLARGIRILWMPELTGTCAWLGMRPERIETLTAALNLDMVGEDQAQCGSTLLIEHPPAIAASFAETLVARIRDEAQEWVASYSGPGHYSLMRMAEVPYGGGSDHAVLVDPTIGVPCPMLIQWPDRFYHSSFDTPDRCDPRSLALAARCAATYAAFLGTARDAEVGWLTGAVERDAQRRLLAAVDRTDPERRMAQERLRGARALTSVGRLGASPQAIAAHVARFESFADSLGAPRPAPASVAAGGSGSRVPRRTKRGPLDFLDHLNEGWGRLDEEQRETWRALRQDVPETFLEIAWFAADGRRSLADIDGLVGLETGHPDLDRVAAFFELTERMGLSAWAGARG